MLCLHGGSSKRGNKSRKLQVSTQNSNSNNIQKLTLARRRYDADNVASATGTRASTTLSLIFALLFCLFTHPAQIILVHCRSKLLTCTVITYRRIFIPDFKQNLEYYGIYSHVHAHIAIFSLKLLNLSSLYLSQRGFSNYEM